MKKEVNLYIHIPFCTSKCKYCRFASFSWLNSLKVQNYVDFLCREILDFDTKEEIFLDTIYFGWWTPSTLNEKQFEKIFTSLQKKFIFKKDIEINIESTPELVTKENLEIWQKFGVTRLSIWVQTLNEQTLTEIKRAQKWDIFEALENVQKSLFFDKNISLDFIIGLPFVKKWELKKDIKFLLEKYDFIKHISVYMLEEYYDVPEEKESKFDEIVYPNSWKVNSIKEEDFLAEYLEIKNFLTEKWFFRYEISNFAKKGFECKHNQGYWKHKENLAFWLGAHSFFENKRKANSENFIDYYAWKNIFIEKIWEKEKFIEKIMFSLRTFWIEKEDLQKLNMEKINYFLKENFLEEKEEKIVLAEKATVYLDFILSEIL